MAADKARAESELCQRMPADNHEYINQMFAEAAEEERFAREMCAEDDGFPSFEEIDAMEGIQLPPEDLESIDLMLAEAVATLAKARKTIAMLKKAQTTKAAAKKTAVRQEQKDRLWQRLCKYRSGAAVTALRHDGGKLVLSYDRCVELLQEFVDENKAKRSRLWNERNHRRTDVYVPVDRSGNDEPLTSP